MEYTVIEELVGKTFKEVRKDRLDIEPDTDGYFWGNIHDNDTLSFIDENGKGYCFYHCQNCCEGVSIEDIVGDLSDLEGSPIIRAEERTESGDVKNDDGWDYGTETWTFYEFATNKGSVTVRWYGSSNGYYSESVDFTKVRTK